MKRSDNVLLLLTPLQTEILWGLVGQANSDGDHYDWLKSAGAPASELKALTQVMALVQEANKIAQQMKVIEQARKEAQKP